MKKIFQKTAFVGVVCVFKIFCYNPSMVDKGEKSAQESASMTMEKYGTDLIERVRGENAVVEKLLSDPPQVILVHIYGAELDEDDKWIPNAEGHYGIRSALEFVHTAREGHADYSPIILTAGGQASQHQGVNISRIYRTAIEEEIRERNLANIKVTDEQEFVEAGNATRLASDTRGELTFLDRFLQENDVESALTIGRIEHGERIQRLLFANGIDASFVSTEGILNHFHPEVVGRFVQRFSEIIESEHNFSEAEKKKMLIMLIDRKGSLIELMSRVAGPLKSYLYKAVGQDEL